MDKTQDKNKPTCFNLKIKLIFSKVFGKCRTILRFIKE